MKKMLLAIATIFGAIVLFLAFRYSEKFTPEDILQQWFDMNIPTRFAFVSDQSSRKLAVVDVEAGQQVGLLDLQMPAKIMAIEKSTGTLAYSDGGQEVILHDLTSHQERKISYSHPVEKIIFSSYSELVAVGKKAISIFSLAGSTSQGETIFPQEKEPLEIVSSVFSPLDQSLWLLDHHAVALLHVDLHKREIEHFPLPQTWQHFSPLAVSPDGEFLLFGGQERERFFAILWRVTQAKIAHSFSLSAPLIQPYIDQNSRHAVIVDHHGKGFIVQAENLNTTPIDVKMQVSGYASVWLDKKLLVIGEQVKLLELSDFKIVDQPKITEPVKGLFIHGNSKVAIFGSQTSPNLYIYHSGEEKLQQVVLNGIQRATQTIMGSSNTICH